MPLLSMFLYPFKSFYLQSSLSRADLTQFLLETSFLQDQGYKKEKDSKKLFYGLVNENEFDLESINDDKMVDHISGQILGVANETYIFIRFGALKHLRFYFIVLFFIAAAIGFISQDILENGTYSLSQPPFMVFFVVFLVLLIYMFYQLGSFQKRLQYSLDFFRGMFQGELISRKDIPVIFKL
jgi:hypothetical protein